MLSSVCCMSLRTAGKVVSWISLVVALLSTVECSFILYRVSSTPYDLHNVDHQQVALFRGSICLAISLLNLLISGLCVLGTIKERHSLLLPWLIYSGIGLTLYSALNLYNLISMLAIKNSSTKYLASNLFCIFIPLGFGMYIHYGIYLLYRQIKHSEKHMSSSTEHVENFLLREGRPFRFFKA